ncbi:ABC transporter permease [Allostella humosa]|nr:ABC transporter permease [Stella humosa]
MREDRAAAGGGRARRLRAMGWMAIALTVALLSLAAGEGGGLALPFQPPGWGHPLGTDDLGRDLAGLLAAGAWTSLLVGGGTVLLALGIGLAAGLVAALGPWWADGLAMRMADMAIALPALLVAIVVAAIFGGSSLQLVLVLGLARWPLIARIVRAEARVALRSELFRAALALGASPLAATRRHLLPPILAAVLPNAGILFGGAILAESTMSFVGLGDAGRTSWGRLAAEAAPYVETAWWMWAGPAAAIAVTAALVAVLTDRASTPAR